MKIVFATIATAAFIIFIGAPAMAATAEATQLAPAIEQCIRSNATKVEQVIPNLNEALNYLVNGVCSSQIDAEYQRLLNSRENQRRADLFEMCEKAKSAHGTTGQDKSGQAANPLCNPGVLEATTNPASTGEDVRAYGMQPHSAAAVSLAAQLLLELRLAHPNSKSQ